MFVYFATAIPALNFIIFMICQGLEFVQTQIRFIVPMIGLKH